MQIKDEIKTAIHFITVDFNNRGELSKERVAEELQRITGKPMLDMVAVYESVDLSFPKTKELDDVTVKVTRVWNDDVDVKNLTFVIYKEGVLEEKDRFRAGMVCGAVMANVNDSSKPIGLKTVDNRLVATFEASQEQKQKFFNELKQNVKIH